MAQQPNFSIKIPSTISLRDIVALVAVAITITISWGVLGTRVTVLEKEVVASQKQIELSQTREQQLLQKIELMENRIRDNEAMMEEIWRKSKH